MKQSLYQGKSPFLVWRKRLNLSINQAAALLGKTRQTVMNLDRGVYGPTVTTRMLMTVIMEGYRPQPWPA